MSSMSYNSAAGLQGMLKDGTRHYSQEDDPFAASVVLRNIDACLQLSKMVSTSLGPQGRCKLVVNHLERIIVTADCASILKEVPVEHPAAQLLSSACQKQEEECGDQTNFVLAFAGELLWQTAMLIGKMTWQPAPEIIAGYEQAMHLIKTDLLPRQVCKTVTDLSDKEQLLEVITPVLASKQYGSEGVLAPLVASACSIVMDSAGKINADSVRTVKILGSSVSQSSLVEGYVARGGVETAVTKVDSSAKIAVYACGFEASSTEAKGTVLMKTADDLKNYNRTEEDKMRDVVAAIASAGVNVVVTGGNVSDMALHFLDRNGMMCLRIGSKWELRRLCRAVSATALVRLGAPMPEEMGVADSVRVREMGGKTVTVFSSKESNGGCGGGSGKLATIVLRAGTSSVLNDLERAVDDGVRAASQAGKDGRLVYGGGAVEAALSSALQREAERAPGLEQYAIAAFGRALDVIPRTLAENAGWNAAAVVADVHAAHAAAHAAGGDGDGGLCDVGVDIDRSDDVDATNPGGLGGVGVGVGVGTAHMKEKGVVDLLRTKLSALRLAVDVALTILKIDQIIMSKPSGGPKP